jgi:hypothetical protein
VLPEDPGAALVVRDDLETAAYARWYRYAPHATLGEATLADRLVVGEPKRERENANATTTSTAKDIPRNSQLPRIDAWSVTVARQVLPGRTYLMSRRCTQRQFLLRPDPRVEQRFLYCLGEAAARYGVTLHGWIALSNHWHGLLRDNRGNFPEFLRHFHAMLAKCLNQYWGRWENCWATEQASAVYLVEPADRFDKLVYLLSNPITEHLVDRVAAWPGACCLPQLLSGRPKTVPRPRGFFREEGPMPEEVTLVAARLDGFEHLSQHEWEATIHQAVREAEDKARAERADMKIRVLGRKAVLRAAHTNRPSSLEPRRELSPQIACRDEERRKAVLAALKVFRIDHRLARLRFAAGDHRVRFPAGTYRARLFGARCAAPPRPS